MEQAVGWGALRSTVTSLVCGDISPRGCAPALATGCWRAVAHPARHHSQLGASPGLGSEVVVAGVLARHGGQLAGARLGPRLQLRFCAPE